MLFLVMPNVGRKAEVLERLLKEDLVARKSMLSKLAVKTYGEIVGKVR